MFGPKKPVTPLTGTLFQEPELDRATKELNGLPPHLRAKVRHIHHSADEFKDPPPPPLAPGRSAVLNHEAADDLSSCFSSEGSYLIPLGDGLVWNVLEQKGHALTFGTSRDGKSVSAINPALLSYAGNMVVVDPKAESAWVTAPRRRQLGQRVVILDAWDEINSRFGSLVGVSEHVTKWNPLSSLRASDRDLSDDLMAIAEALVIPTGGDSHWVDSARDLVAGLCAAVVELMPGFGNLGDVRRLLTDDEAVLLKWFNRILKTIPRASPQPNYGASLRA